MRKLLIILFLFGLTLGVSACQESHPELKSPCVGIDGSPCERRKPNENVV